jgi:hypothetical protein
MERTDAQRREVRPRQADTESGGTLTQSGRDAHAVREGQASRELRPEQSWTLRLAHRPGRSTHFGAGIGRPSEIRHQTESLLFRAEGRKLRIQRSGLWSVHFRMYALGRTSRAHGHPNTTPPPIISAIPLSHLRRMRGDEIGKLDTERGRNLVQRFQRGIGCGDFHGADERLTHLRRAGEVVLRP